MNYNFYVLEILNIVGGISNNYPCNYILLTPDVLSSKRILQDTNTSKYYVEFTYKTNTIYLK